MKGSFVVNFEKKIGREFVVKTFIVGVNSVKILAELLFVVVMYVPACRF